MLFNLSKHVTQKPRSFITHRQSCNEDFPYFASVVHLQFVGVNWYCHTRPKHCPLCSVLNLVPARAWFESQSDQITGVRIINLHALRLSSQESSTVLSTICDHRWHLKIMALKCHRGWAAENWGQHCLAGDP